MLPLICCNQGNLSINSQKRAIRYVAPFLSPVEQRFDQVQCKSHNLLLKTHTPRVYRTWRIHQIKRVTSVITIWQCCCWQ